MKKQFDTIKGQSVSKSWATKDGKGQSSTKSPPPSATMEYETEHLSVYVIKPESEGSFSKIVRDGTIKMTPYSKGRTHTTNYLATTRHLNAGTEWDSWYDKQKGNHFFSGYQHLVCRYERINSLKTVIDQGVYLHSVNYKKRVDMTKQMNRVKSNVISDSMSGFDALTNLAEFPESLEMILTALKNARKPLEGIRELISKYKEAKKDKKTSAKINADLSRQWMQYRYGIMPLVFSIQDAIKLLDQQMAEYHTVHSGHTVNISETSQPQSNIEIGSYLYQTVSGTIKIRATGKARYTTPSLRLSDLITVNPFLTAWELIPMSFVIDWFINVGDVLFSRTSGLVDLASERKFCISVKEDLIVKTIYHASYDESYHFKTDGFPLPLRTFGLARPPYEYNVPLVVKEDFIMQQQKISTYDRQLFKSTDVEFEFLPSLSWMRMLDGYVLSFKSIAKALKKLS